MGSSRDCSYTTNAAPPPQTQITSAEKKAAEAAGILQISYYDPANVQTSLASDEAINFGQAMLRTAQMAGRHYGGVNDTPPPYTPPNSD